MEFLKFILVKKSNTGLKFKPRVKNLNLESRSRAEEI